jgi:HK97 family phage prohead protease
MLTRSADGVEHFEGYAALFWDGTDRTEYRPLPNVRERIARSAFAGVISQPCSVWYNHSPDHDLGQTALTADDKGVRFNLPYDGTDPDHVKVRRKIEKGIATGCSFQALVSCTMKKTGKEYMRTLDKVELLREVSIVNNPAYKATEVTIRNDIATYERIMRSRSLI